MADSFSTDKKVDVCTLIYRAGISRAWLGHIDQKNYAIGLAKNDWILSLDAEERLSPGFILEIQDVIRNPGDTVGFLFPRCAFYLNRWIYHGD
ncbi:MAG: hypothetical protein QG591_2564 [Planctomycetota bacterium]|nr:hypothetical protein [Planctomycetota bacterium]